MAKRPTSFKPTQIGYYHRGRAPRRIGAPVGVMFGAVAVGLLVGTAPALMPATTTHPRSYAEPLSGCRITDGDTIRCGSERIRLLAIDAPELPRHCREGRVCVPGDPYASTASLEAALTSPLTIDRVDKDHYGRTLARVAGGKGDLSCWQLAHKQAVYKSAWDNGLRVARTCPRAVLG